MGCRKHSPGTPCCEECCCIERVEIDFAVPDVGQPGASIGTLAWDVVEEPYLREYFDGPDKVYECTYVAPETNLCTSSFPINAQWPQISRTIPADTLVLDGVSVRAVEYIGTVTFKTNEFARFFRLIVSKKGSQYKTAVSGEIWSEYLNYQTPGGVITDYRQSGYTCTVFSTSTYTATYDTLMCSQAPDVLCRSAPDRVPAFAVRRGYYSTNILIESAWTTATCATLPSNISLSSKWSEYNADPSPPGSNAQECRVPTGSTPGSDGSSNLCGTDLYATNLYSSLVEWTCKHTFRVTPCS